MTFDPDNAIEELEEESPDAAFMDALMDRYEETMKKSRMKVVNEAFKGVLDMAKEERGQLLEQASTKLTAAMEAALAKATSEHTSRLQAEHNRLASRVEKIVRALETQQRPAEAPLSPELVTDLVSTLAALREGLNAKETPAAAAPQAPAKPRTYRHEIKRDDFARICEVISTEVV